MTYRINHITVALEKDTREDDCEQILAAISMIKGVLKVTPHAVDGSGWTAEQRARHDLGQKLLAVVYPKT